MPDVQFEESRLAAVYDEMCAGRDDTAYYLALAGELRAEGVLDVGCGTGVLAVDLARAGHRVAGVDPGAAMLAVARARPGAERVTWLDGDASVAPSAAFDLAIMTGHVAQVFTDEDSWRRTLCEIHRALAPGGRVAFELRRPEVRVWTSWNPDDSRVHVTHPTEGPVTAWVETIAVDGDLVTFRWTYEFVRTGARLRSTSTLRFPDAATVERSLAATGFDVESVLGDWDRSPVRPESHEQIYVARRS